MRRRRLQGLTVSRQSDTCNYRWNPVKYRRKDVIAVTDNDKIQSFGDMVDAVEKLTKPVQEENERLHAQIDKMHQQMWWERIVFGVLLLAFIAFAYLTPIEVEQGQQFEQKTQSQSYSDGFTGGK